MLGYHLVLGAQLTGAAVVALLIAALDDGGQLSRRPARRLVLRLAGVEVMLVLQQRGAAGAFTGLFSLLFQLVFHTLRYHGPAGVLRLDAQPCFSDRLCTPFQAEADAAPVRLIVRRVKPTPGSQLALFAIYSYHGFITDRDGELLELEADHRRHAEIENAIRDLKYGVGLNHLPSGRFPANGAWLAVQTMAHNLARWTARIGLGEQVVTTKTLRRRFFSLAGRLTRSARRLTLHLPDRWPWAEKFSRALARLRAIPLPA